MCYSSDSANWLPRVQSSAVRSTPSQAIMCCGEVKQMRFRARVNGRLLLHPQNWWEQSLSSSITTLPDLFQTMKSSPWKPQGENKNPQKWGTRAGNQGFILWEFEKTSAVLVGDQPRDPKPPHTVLCTGYCKWPVLLGGRQGKLFSFFSQPH